jgi:hypothetical protein
MERTRAWLVGLAIAASLGAAPAPATPTYVAIEAAICRVEEAWAKPGAKPDPNAPGWNALFQAIRKDLAAYAGAGSENDRLRALGHLYQISVAFDSVSWAPAVEVRSELRTWLRPRVTLAWASKKLVETINGLPATADAGAQGNRDRWVRFVGEDLGSALRGYEGASEVRDRRAALAKVYTALNNLQARNQAVGWGPSVELQAAVNDLYNGPNLQATADPASVAPKLANYVAQSGPVVRKGQTSYVTAGPYLGFGLMASDDGIMFYNSQAVSSVTPINGFQQQLEDDRKGRRAAKLYQFNATSYDQSTLTIIAVLRPSGLQLFPQSTHGVDAAVGATPQPGKGLARGFASLLGMNQAKITQKVYEGAIGEIRTSIRRESQEEATERANARAAQTNARLGNVFLGPDTLAIKNVEVDGLKLRSRPEFAMIDGRVKWRGAAGQVGAEMPKPSKFATPQAGISADVHIGSVATNFVRGFLEAEHAQSVKNLMIVTRKPSPDAPSRTITPNVSYADYLKAANEARAANDPQVQAIRVIRPDQSPEFSVDRNGYLVATLHGFSLEVPAPEAAAKGGLFGPPAKVYRIDAPDAELIISLQVTPGTNDAPIRLHGRIEGYDSGARARVLAINDDESKATALSGLSSTPVLAVFGSKLKGMPIDIPLSDLNLPGFVLTSVSPIDPTGWVRVVLAPTPAADNGPRLPTTPAAEPVKTTTAEPASTLRN